MVRQAAHQGLVLSGSTGHLLTRAVGALPHTDPRGDRPKQPDRGEDYLTAVARTSRTTLSGSTTARRRSPQRGPRYLPHGLCRGTSPQLRVVTCQPALERRRHHTRCPQGPTGSTRYPPLTSCWSCSNDARERMQSALTRQFDRPEMEWAFGHRGQLLPLAEAASRSIPWSRLRCR